MCPEASTLSAYFDGELEGAAFDAIETHVNGCATCRTSVDRYGNLSGQLTTPVPSDSDVNAIAVRAKLHVTTRAAMTHRSTVWRTSFTIPAPVAALAAMVVIALTFSLFLTNQESGLPIEAVSDRRPTEFGEIVEYLESRQVAEAVTFLLPKNTILRVMSEPAFVRAAEYDRVYK